MQQRKHRGRRRTVNGATTVFVTDAGNREVLEYDGASGAIQLHQTAGYAFGSNPPYALVRLSALIYVTTLKPLHPFG